MKLLLKGIFFTLLLLSRLTAGDIEIFTSENSNGKITPATIEKAFKDAGFFISSNRNMNGPFLKQFKKSSFDTYNLFTFYKPDSVLALAKKYPNVGLFAPMSMSIYSKKGEKTISVASLTAEAMAKIMKAPSNDKTLQDLRRLIKKTLKSVMPKAKLEELSYNVELSPKGFVMAGFNNLGDDFEDANYEGFDFYEVYSICKLAVIYTIAKTHPEAGAYAPCSLYLSKKKGADNMKIAFPSVYNWMSSMSIENKNDIKILETAQKGMKKILTSITE